MRGAVLVARVCAFLVLFACNVYEFPWRDSGVWVRLVKHPDWMGMLAMVMIGATQSHIPEDKLPRARLGVTTFMVACKVLDLAWRYAGSEPHS